MNDIIKKYIVIRFDTVQQGIDFMSSYEYTSAFIVVDTIYDKNGLETTYEHSVELNLVDIRNVIIDTGLFIESEICYDGDNLYIYKG